MIEVRGLSKRYGAKVALRDLTFDVLPGRVTGFLGPNGAGKSTTMRIVLGLDAPTTGLATINGMPYRALHAPLRQVGALLEAKATQGGRRAYHHLLALARSNGIPPARVDETLEVAGLTAVAQRRVKDFSLGMSQRLGIAAALLGDPEVLVLDEPANGLDTEGIAWIRDMLKTRASEGRTIFVSSHLMSEVELTADHLVVIGRGRLIADMPTHKFIAENSRVVTRARSPRVDDLRHALEANGADVQLEADGACVVGGLSAEAIGDIAFRRGIVLHELTPRRSSLEQVYMDLTKSSVEYGAVGSEPTR